MKVTKWALMLAASALFSIGAEAATSATVSQGTWDLYRQDTDAKVGYYSSETACVNAATAITATAVATLPSSLPCSHASAATIGPDP